MVKAFFGAFSPMNKYMLYGASGYIGSHILASLEGVDPCGVAVGTARLGDRTKLWEEISSVGPTHLICAAGLKGKPNVVCISCLSAWLTCRIGSKILKIMTKPMT